MWWGSGREDGEANGREARQSGVLSTTTNNIRNQSQSKIRGLKIALRILEKGVNAQIGVTTGVCFCGTIGSSFRGDFAVVGDHINMAARLMSNAEEGSVLCDNNTRVAACMDKSLCFSDAQKLRVKGKSKALVVYNPSRKIYSIMGEVDFLSTQKSPLVGNAEAWKELQSSHARRSRHMSSEQPPQLVIVAGKKMSGKTKTITYFQHMQKLEQIPILTGRADKFEDSTPYFIWRSILYNIFEHGRSRSLKNFESNDGMQSMPSDNHPHNQAGYYFEELFSRSTAINDMQKAPTEESWDKSDEEVNLLSTLRPSKNRRLSSRSSDPLSPSNLKTQNIGKPTSSLAMSLQKRNVLLQKQHGSMRGKLTTTKKASAYSLMTEIALDEQGEEDNPEDEKDDVNENENKNENLSKMASPSSPIAVLPLTLTTSHPIGSVSIIMECVENQKIDAELLCLLNMIMPSFAIPPTKVVMDMSENVKQRELANLMTELLFCVRELHTGSKNIFSRNLSSSSFGSNRSSDNENDNNNNDNDNNNNNSNSNNDDHNSNNNSNNNNSNNSNNSPVFRNNGAISPETVGPRGHRLLQPLSIFFDDFQNIDFPSMQLMKSVLKSPKLNDCLCVITHNEEKNLSAYTKRNFSDISYSVVRLQPLTRMEISSVLHSEFSLSMLESQVLEKIFVTSNGYPGSAVNELQKLLDTGLLKIDNATANCTLREDAEVFRKYVSEDLEKQAMDIFSSLDHKSKYIVQLCSITGQQIRIQLLEDMYVNLVGKSEETKSKEDFEETSTSQRKSSIAAMAENTVLNRKKAFISRIQDLIDAKVVDRVKVKSSLESDEEFDGIEFLAPGVSEMAYSVSLYTLREAGHKFVVDWYRENLSKQSLTENSAFLYHHSLGSMEFPLAANFLFESCAYDLKFSNAALVQKRLKHSEGLFASWSQQIIDNLEDPNDDTAHDTAREDQHSMKAKKGEEIVPMSSKLFGVVGAGAGAGGSKEEIAYQKAKLQALKCVENGKMRCVFFCGLAFVELNDFKHALVCLESVMKYCRKNGAGRNKGILQRLARLLGISKKQEMVYFQNHFDDDDDNDISGLNMLNALLESSTQVHAALNDIVSMQTKQQEVLRKIAHNTHINVQGGGGGGGGGGGFGVGGRKSEKTDKSNTEKLSPELSFSKQFLLNMSPLGGEKKGFMKNVISSSLSSVSPVMS